jgi:CrcB protein
MNFALVFLGGGLGSLLRYAFSVYLPSNCILPIATFSANFASSFLLGVFISLYASTSNQKLFLATGFCGGFSTFSTFSAETLNLFQQGNYTGASVNIVLNVVCCIAAVAGGLFMANKF